MKRLIVLTLALLPERLTQGTPEHSKSNQNKPAVRVHLVNLY